MRIQVSGCSVPQINGTYVEDSHRRNSRRCFSKVDGPGALYFDGTYWKLSVSGGGPNEDGWNFSQLPENEELPPPAWLAGRNTTEDIVDYAGLRLTVLVNPQTAKVTAQSAGSKKPAAGVLRTTSHEQPQLQRRGRLAPRLRLEGGLLMPIPCRSRSGAVDRASLPPDVIFAARAALVVSRLPSSGPSANPPCDSCPILRVPHVVRSRSDRT
jgi:hypothetical protein